ncbi:MAG: hypothetical protein KJ789_03820, partial [Alphaproteobacteria bacterium]|nr:hypothetical protein [Alphaproteobacteria bacterium]
FSFPVAKRNLTNQARAGSVTSFVQRGLEMQKSRWILWPFAILLCISALLAVLVVAIPSGKIDSLQDSTAQNAPVGRASVRQVFSPTISDDPYVVNQWEKSIQALEKACRDTGQYCDHARNARITINR